MKKEITYNQLYQEWQEFLRARYPRYVLLNKTDFFGIIDSYYYPKKKYREQLKKEFLRKYKGRLLVFENSGRKYKIK